MSFDIDWESIANDSNINSQLLHFLNDKFSSIVLPDYLSGLKVVKFSLGHKSPELTIRDIDQPFEEFYSEIEPIAPPKPKPVPVTPLKASSKAQFDVSRSPSPANTRRSDNDIQFSLDFKLDSNIYIEVVCNLLINYPTHEFIKLPVRLKITDLQIHSLAVVAYVQKHVFITFLCDIDDEDTAHQSAEEGRQDSRKSSVSEIPHTVLSSRDRIDIIRNLKIEGELGSHQDTPSLNQGSILRNIGKIEKFLVGAIRNILIEELAWPSWIELDLTEDS
ncbi:uncharacterized protein OGAPODRAFT_99400 [Ogataea polymorpha]|uniref:uncharacterized protein n=1 Tax=Ogataea polymorpha TaxID=460523 RepID=UPI0007F537DF|nr:uncharacterized protein OGAPODRAFT_99400 [Ogataea polymorpha]OBA16553.1 hypothetical protein OGAPODRAFT_99400 [Ogataea polymorpha]